jgi:hypothetical protein
VNPVALYDALNCASLAVLHAETGDADRASVALFEASLAAADAFPEDSREAQALAVILDAAARVQEAVA